jgi:hypothetical protein
MKPAELAFIVAIAVTAPLALMLAAHLLIASWLS